MPTPQPSGTVPTINGGIDYPYSPVLIADHLIISGWCLNGEIPIAEAGIFSDGMRIGEAEVGLASPRVRLSHPELAQSSFAGFRMVTPVRSILSGNMALSRITPSAVCRFEDGREHTLKINPFVLIDRDIAIKSPQRITENILSGITSCELTSERFIRLRGYLFNPYPEPPRFYLRSPRKVVAISEPEFLSNHSPYDAWYPLDGAATGAAFELQFSPWILGGVPAAVQLVAVVGNRQVVLSQEYSGQQIIRNIAFGLGETKPRSLISRWIGGLSLVGQARVPVEEGFVRPRTNGILVVAHNVSPFEGAPRVLLKLLKEYKQNHPGVSVSVLSLRADSPSADVLAVADNFYSAPQPLVPPYDETRFAEIVGLVDDTLCRVKPDLVITNVIDSFPAVFAAKRRGLEVHWMIHESKKPETSFLDSLPEIQQVYLNALTTADRLIFVSASTAALYLGVRGDRPISIAANGLDLSEIDKFKSEWSVVKAKAALGVGDELVVSIIGTVDSRKGQDIFVREMALLRDHLGTMRLRCFIVGCRGGDFLERLRREILKLRLDDVISLVDESPHVGLYLQATDVVCICSREESAPLVVLEAMGFAKPIVSTAVFGLSEQLRDRSDALIFDHKIVGDLAEKIICLINEPGLRDQISVEARRSVESRFTIKAQYEVFAQGIKVT